MEKKVAQNISKIITLPVKLPINDEIVIVDQYDVGRFDDIYKLIVSAAESGDGLTKDETGQDEIMNRILNGIVYLAVIETTGELVAFMVVNPSAMCRSYEPMCTAVISLIKKEYRGKGLFETLASCIAFHVGSSFSFIGK